MRVLPTNSALSRSSSAKYRFPGEFASFAIDLNIKLATSAEPIWSGQRSQKYFAKDIRLKNTAQTNSSLSGLLTTSTAYILFIYLFKI